MSVTGVVLDNVSYESSGESNNTDSAESTSTSVNDDSSDDVGSGDVSIINNYC